MPDYSLNYWKDKVKSSSKSPSSVAPKPTSVVSTGGSGQKATFADGTVAQTSSNPVAIKTVEKKIVNRADTAAMLAQNAEASAKPQVDNSNFGKMESLTGYESEAGLTPEMMLNEQAKGLQKTEEALFGKSQLDIKTGENLYTIQAKKKKEDDAKALATMQAESDLAAANEQASFDTMKQQEKAGTAAITAATSGGREGIISEGNQRLGKQVTQEMNGRIDLANRNVEMAKTRREQVMADLKAAQASGNLQLAQSYQQDLANAQNDLMNADAQRAQTIADANQQGIDMIKQMTSLSDGLSGAFAGEIAGMSVPDIQSVYGLDSSTAMIFKTSAMNKAAIDPSDPEYRKKMAQADEAEQNALFAGMTTEQKNFEYYKQMMAYDPQGAKQFAQAAGLNEQQSFFANFNQQFEVEQANVQKTFEATGVKVPIKSKYAYDVTPDGSVSLERSAPAGAKPARGQCGMFVNDILGGGLIKDSWASKKALVNSQVPVAGCAFMEATGEPWGHTGFVEKVYKDENGKVISIDIRESNYVATETVSTANIKVGSDRWNKMSGNRGGFFIPGSNRAKDQTVGGELAEGLDPSQAPSPGTENPLLDQFAQAFADKTYDVADLKAMGMNPSDISMVAAAAMGKKKEVDTSNFETYAKAFSEGDLSLTDLKTLGVPEEYLGRIAAVGIQNKGMFGEGEGDGSRTTAEAILNSGGTMTIADVPMDERAAVQAQINQLKSDPNFTANESSGARGIAETIASGLSTLTLSQLPQAQRVEVEKELVNIRKDLIKSGDIYGAMKATAGGKDVSETFMNSFEKSKSVISQVEELGKLFSDKKKAKDYAESSGVDAAPFTAWFKKKNKWDEDSQAISASINGIVPNLARGIFGEVGVLTDRDIEQYSKIVPNLDQPETTQKVITALLLTNLEKSMKSKIETQIGANRDVSNYVDQYQEVANQLNQINVSLGIKPGGQKQSAQGFRGLTGGLKSKVSGFFGGGQPLNPFDDLDTDDGSDFLANFNN